MIALAVFGLLIEIIQYFLPWRSFSLLDWLADIIGILTYDVVHRLKRRYYLKNSYSQLDQNKDEEKVNV
jgi:VanZ family protein